MRRICTLDSTLRLALLAVGATALAGVVTNGCARQSDAPTQQSASLAAATYDTLDDPEVPCLPMQDYITNEQNKAVAAAGGDPANLSSELSLSSAGGDIVGMPPVRDDLPALRRTPGAAEPAEVPPPTDGGIIVPLPPSNSVCCTFDDGSGIFSETNSCPGVGAGTYSAAQCCKDRATGVFTSWKVLDQSTGACGSGPPPACSGYMCEAPVRNLGCAGTAMNMSGLKHQFVMVKCQDGSTYESGLGVAGGGVPGEDGAYNPPCTTGTSWNNHSGQSNLPGTSCYQLAGCDTNCLKTQTAFNKPMGGFCAPNGICSLNQCNGAAFDALTACGCQDRCLEWGMARYVGPYCTKWAMSGAHF
jgi:hypothetical protein